MDLKNLYAQIRPLGGRDYILIRRWISVLINYYYIIINCVLSKASQSFSYFYLVKTHKLYTFPGIPGGRLCFPRLFLDTETVLS